MNTFTIFLLDFIKLVAAGAAVFFIAYSVLKSELENSRKVKLIEIKKTALATTLPLRLQAYERMALFIERLNPSSLLVRLHSPGLTVLQMQQLLISEIQNEFNHNVTQQIYLSTDAWSIVRRLKDDTVNLINNSARSLSYDAPSIELSKVVLSQEASMENNPYDAAINLIKSDLKDVL